MSIQDKTVKYTIPTKTAITLVENTIDNTSTTLELPYQNDVNINRIVNNNLIHLVENFCSNTAPSPAIEGQLWLDTSDADNKQELGRLKIYMYQTAGLQFVDVAGTVMDKFGNLRHTGHIEAFNDLNNIPVNTNEFPDDPDYYRFLTTKAHCDSNYLSGYYSTDNTEFFIRGNRPVTYTKELIFGLPFATKDSRTLIQKKFVDTYYLFGKTNLATSFNITNDKKLYYDNSIEMTQDFQLITKIKCDDKFAESIATVSNLAANIVSTAEKIKHMAYDPFNANDLARSGAIAIADEVKRLVAARPRPGTPTPTVLTLGGCTITGTAAIVQQGSASLVGISKIHVGVKWYLGPANVGVDADYAAIGYSKENVMLVRFNYAGVSAPTLVPGSSSTQVHSAFMYEDLLGYGYDGTKYYKLNDPTNTAKQFTTFEACIENEACDIDLTQVDASIEYFTVSLNGRVNFDTYSKCQIAVYDTTTGSTPLTSIDLVTTAVGVSNKIVAKIKRVTGGWTFEAL
jgi:hypothetical protein